MALYTSLSESISLASVQEDQVLAAAVLWSWGIHLEDSDHEFILRSGVLQTLSSLMAVSNMTTDKAIPAPAPVTPAVDSAGAGAGAGAGEGTSFDCSNVCASCRRHYPPLSHVRAGCHRRCVPLFMAGASPAPREWSRWEFADVRSGLILGWLSKFQVVSFIASAPIDALLSPATLKGPLPAAGGACPSPCTAGRRSLAFEGS